MVKNYARRIEEIKKALPEVMTYYNKK